MQGRLETHTLESGHLTIYTIYADRVTWPYIMVRRIYHGSTLMKHERQARRLTRLGTTMTVGTCQQLPGSLQLATWHTLRIIFMIMMPC